MAASSCPMMRNKGGGVTEKWSDWREQPVLSRFKLVEVA